MPEDQDNSAQLTLSSKTAAQQSPEFQSRPERSAVPVLRSKQPQPAPEGKCEACGRLPAALPKPMPLPTSKAGPAEPEQAFVAATSDQHASAECSEPASAAGASRSRGDEPMPATEECQPLHLHEQKVAAALLVVLKKALRDGPAAMMITHDVLLANNPQLAHFLRLVSDDGKLPSLKQLERSASPAHRDWLDYVSQQCVAAECQPLELFTRSAQCHTHLRAWQAAARGESAARQERLQALRASLPISSTAEAGQRQIFERLQIPVGQLAKHGISLKLRNLTVVLLSELVLLLDADKRYEETAPQSAASASSFITCFDHMLPGVLDSLLQHQVEDLTSVHALLTMQVYLEGALSSYRDRAAAAKKTTTQIVRLEAAVQDWPDCAPQGSKLVQNIITTLIPGATMMLSVDDAMALAKEMDSQRALEQTHNPAVMHLHKCPADVATILIMKMGLINVGTAPRALNAKEYRLKALLTALFPGIQEELYCACNSDSDMCPGMLMSAARHVESYVKVWMSEANQHGIGLPDQVSKHLETLGFAPSELPINLQKAIRDTCARVEADVDNCKVHWHIDLTKVLGAMQKIPVGDEDPTVKVWLVKALAQLIDINIYCESNANVKRAENALMKGTMVLFMGSRTAQQGVGMEVHVKKMLQPIEDLVNKHVLDARRLGKSLRAHLEDTAGFSKFSREPGHEIVNHLIDILADFVSPNMSEGSAWRAHDGVHNRLLLDDLDDLTEMRKLVSCAFSVPELMGDASYNALKRVFPGLPDAKKVPNIALSMLVETARPLKLQIQVYKHIASLQKRSLPIYIDELLNSHGVDTHEVAAAKFCVEFYETALRVKVFINAAKKMHISMCVKAILHGSPAAVGDYLLVLLDKLTSICAENAGSLPIVKAINQALLGVWLCLFRLHKWPHGLDKELKWLSQATQLIGDITAQHATDACRRGISHEEHVRSIFAVPGLQDEEAKLLMSMFRDFWAAQGEEAASYGPRAEIFSGAASEGPGKGPAEDSSTADEQLTEAAVNGTVSGQDMPAQEAEEAADSQSGAEKANKRKAKKARQRAARAHAAAQMTEAKGRESKQPDRAESMGSASKHDSSAQAEAAQQTPKAGQLIGDYVSPAPESLPPPDTPAQSGEAVARSKSSSISPQPSLHVPTGTPRKQQERDLPKQPAPNAQPLGPLTGAQEQGPWQEVRNSRRKPSTQQAASVAGARKAPSQSQDATDQYKPHPSRPQPWKPQVADWQQGQDQLPTQGMPQPDLRSACLSQKQVAKVGRPEEGDDDDDEDDLCVVCWERLAEVIFYPCMHMCTCQSCARDIMAAGGLCPMCRTKIQSTTKTRF